MVVLQDKVIDLSTFLIEFVLTEKEISVICSAALVLYLCWMHDTLRINYHVNKVLLTLYFELELKVWVSHLCDRRHRFEITT